MNKKEQLLFFCQHKNKQLLFFFKKQGLYHLKARHDFSSSAAYPAGLSILYFCGARAAKMKRLNLAFPPPHRTGSKMQKFSLSATASLRQKSGTYAAPQHFASAKIFLYPYLSKPKNYNIPALRKLCNAIISLAPAIHYLYIQPIYSKSTRKFKIRTPKHKKTRTIYPGFLKIHFYK